MNVILSEATSADLDTLLSFMRQLRIDDPMPDLSPAATLASATALRRLIGDAILGRVWVVRWDPSAAIHAPRRQAAKGAKGDRSERQDATPPASPPTGPAAVGYVALTFCYSLELGGRCAFIDELFVEKSYRGRGIGGQALRQVEAAATGLGVRVLLLEVSPGNAAAAGLYEQAGFLPRKYRLLTKRLAPSEGG